MKKSVLVPMSTFVFGVLVTAIYFNYSQKHTPVESILSRKPDPLITNVVYSIADSITEGYYFPTHDNLIVQVAPEKFTHRHVHDDTEQIFFILSGKGRLDVERNGKKESFILQPKDFVHVPRNCYHQTFCEGTDSLKYLAIDCFPNGHNPDEPTWDSHARAVCDMNGWSYEASRIKKN
jgi:mannose-6-phosphate isomerase-like protein (cupin superfamily)